jgi:hypothetical protein
MSWEADDDRDLDPRCPCGARAEMVLDENIYCEDCWEDILAAFEDIEEYQ